MNIRVIDTGSANVRSVNTALMRAGMKAQPVRSAEDVIAADRVLLPGVGAFGAAMAQLVEQDLVEALRERLRAGWPTLAVCIGLQLLCEASEEDEGVEGIGVVPATVGRFAPDVHVPHMGWNRVTAPDQATWIGDGYAYFANSYRLGLSGEEDRARLEAAGFSIATCDYAGSFVAAIARDGLLACQFHPELSGPWGLELLRRWAQRSEEVTPC